MQRKVQQIQEKDQQIRDKDQQIRDKDQQTRDKDQQIRDKDQRLRRMQQQVLVAWHTLQGSIQWGAEGSFPPNLQPSSPNVACCVQCVYNATTISM